MGYVIFENSERIRIECRRVEERLFFREGTETGVEVVEPFVCQFEGENFLLDDFSDLLMSANVRAEVVSGKPRISAFQQIAFSLKGNLLRQMGNLEPLMAKPLFEVCSLAAPNLVAEVADDKLVLPDEAGVGRKDHIRQPELRLDQANIDGQALLEEPAQRIPLLLGSCRITRVAPAHPGINFVLNAVIVGRAHQELHNDTRCSLQLGAAPDKPLSKCWQSALKKGSTS